MVKKDNTSSSAYQLQLSPVEPGQIKPVSLPEGDCPGLLEDNQFRSAGALMKAIADEALSWRQSLPKGFQPAIVAILQGGIQIEVNSLAQVSFHGIKIEGTMGGSLCVMFAHQASVQMLCRAVEIKEKEPVRPIGFIWPDKKLQI